jgi:NAD(P)-dependent dehydrogenase (short-subunit alcohol dehydrogenase family)
VTLANRPKAVVTGAGSGLGRALCLALAERGGRVLAVDLKPDRAEETAAEVRARGGEAEAIGCDVARWPEVEVVAARADAWLGEVDLLVNNAGVAVAGPTGEVSLEDWRWILDINLMGVVHGLHAFVPRLARQRHGAILNTASAAGLVSMPHMAAYNATKAAVVAISETLSVELAPDGIGVTVLCPTFFATGLLDEARAASPDHLKAGRKLFAKAKVTADDVARRALASVERGELYCVPMADGRAMWRAKRMNPAAFAAGLRKAFQTDSLAKYLGVTPPRRG